MESDKKNSVDLPQNLEPISSFQNDSDFVFIYRKTEKLVTAIYLVTNLFSDNEPLKWTLRNKAAVLLSFMVDYKNISALQQMSFVKEVKTKVLEIVSFLEISSASGILSKMNYSILKQEFVSLNSTFDTLDVTNRDSNIFSKNFFDLPRVNNFKSEQPRTIESALKDSILIKDKSELKKSDRQNAILSLLKKHKELTIKDLSLVIKDCSEKTIQRELIYFIKVGVVRKTGQRRWSRYSLI